MIVQKIDCNSHRRKVAPECGFARESPKNKLNKAIPKNQDLPKKNFSKTFPMPLMGIAPHPLNTPLKIPVKIKLKHSTTQISTLKTYQISTKVKLLLAIITGISKQLLFRNCIRVFANTVFLQFLYTIFIIFNYLVERLAWCSFRRLLSLNCFVQTLQIKSSSCAFMCIR